jgi:hypothetical protein
MVVTGSGANDPRWLETLVQHPPSCLSQLEYWVGSLDVDFAGGEGMGYLQRPAAPTPRGTLRADVARLGARFAWDMHHERPERPRDMRLRSFWLVLDLGHATVAKLLGQRHGAGHVIDTKDGPIVEYGQWFYLRMQPDGAAQLTWEAERPEWALPAVAPDTREHLLVALFDRLVCDTTIDPIHAAIEPLVGAAGAELLRWNAGQLDLTFRPGLPLATLTTVFRWDQPVASSSDVHMSSWRVYPHRPTTSWSEPHVGPWWIEARLDGWPRGDNGAELPQIGRAGPSPLYDVRGCTNTVIGLTVRLPP